MTPTEILEQILKDKNLNYSDLAKEIGVDRSTFTKVINGDTKTISSNLSRKINARFPDITIEWLRGIEVKSTENQQKSTMKNIFPVTFNNIDEFAEFFIKNQADLLEHDSIDKLINIYEQRAVNNVIKNRGR